MFAGSVGRGALFLLLFVVPGIFLLSAIAAKTGREQVAKWARGAIVLQFALTAIASACLLYLLIHLDYRYTYVADYTSDGLALLYRIAAFWGGDAGSLLFWVLIVSLYLFVASRTRHEDSERMLPVVAAIMSFVMMFFVLVLNFVAKPFVMSAVAPVNGNGLNPLLQNPGMTVHPVNLYLGYVGFLVPFAYGMAALILKKTDAMWLTVTRKWTLISWLFLSCGILYGARWSYEELGWGGYWSWDPIENAALMPWIAATAFTHSSLIQERRGQLKKWNIILISLTYLLTLFGTALTRGGLLWSIHAFANGPVGTVFMSFVGLMTILTVALIVWRWPTLRAEAKFDGAISKETGFMLNNLLFVGALFAVFWGTIFPLVSEAVTGSQMLVSGPFYDSVVLPIGVALVLLMGIGPLLAWRRTHLRSLGRMLLWPTVGALVVGVVTWTLGYQNLLSLFSYMSAAFVVIATVAEFVRAAQARMRVTGEPVLRSTLSLVAKNRRRYGGYVVHLAVVVMVIGFATTGAYAKQVTLSMTRGQQQQVGNYLLTFHGLRTVDKPGQEELQGEMLVSTIHPARQVGVVLPSVDFYLTGDQPTTNMGLYSTPLADLYVVLDGSDFKTGQSLFEIHLNPLVDLIWFGGYLYVLGTFISLWPERRRGRQVALAHTGKSAVLVGLADLEYDFQMGKLQPAQYELLKQDLVIRLTAAEALDTTSEHSERIGERLEREVRTRLTAAAPPTQV